MPDPTTTTVYVPTLITEGMTLDMETYPPGTVATHPDHPPVERCECSRWEDGQTDRYDPDMVGWTALVPITATEAEQAFRRALDDMHRVINEESR